MLIFIGLLTVSIITTCSRRKTLEKLASSRSCSSRRSVEKDEIEPESVVMDETQRARKTIKIRNDEENEGIVESSPDIRNVISKRKSMPEKRQSVRGYIVTMDPDSHRQIHPMRSDMKVESPSNKAKKSAKSRKSSRKSSRSDRKTPTSIRREENRVKSETEKKSKKSGSRKKRFGIFRLKT